MSIDPSQSKRLLFVAYWFPPIETVACVRTFQIAKQLSQKGWRVTVVTPSADNWREVEHDGRVERLVAQEGVRLIATAHRWRCLSPEKLVCPDHGLRHLLGKIVGKIMRYFGIERECVWLKEAEKACALLKRGDFDVVLASGGPFVSFQLAKNLSGRLCCPFVVDYRDLWTGNPHRDRQDWAWTVRKERDIFNSCAAATVVSPSMKVYLSGRLGGEDKLHVVSNGFDADDLMDVQPTNFGHFSIVYAGSFYIPISTAGTIMAVLKRLQSSMSDKLTNWHFHYYGWHGAHVEEEARNYGVLDRVTIHGVVSRREVHSAVRGADVAVVIASVNAKPTLEEKGIVTGKLFETLGLGTPVLLVAPDDNDASKIVRATGAGRQFLGSQTEEMVSFLKEIMTTKTARVPIPNQFSWQAIAGELDKVLSAVRVRSEG